MKKMSVGKKGCIVKISKNQLIQMFFRGMTEDIMVYGKDCCVAYDSWECLCKSCDKKKAKQYIDDVVAEGLAE